MKKIILKNTFVTDVELLNKPIAPPQPMKLTQKFTYNVKYTKTNICRSELVCNIGAEGRSDFKINFTIVGIFEYDSSLNKEEIHRLSYISIYPFARAFCVNLTTSCGMAPLYISEIDVDSQEIFRIDLGGIKG